MQAANPLYPVESAFALHGRDYATLSADERAVFDYYANQEGRKLGIVFRLIQEPDPAELRTATSVAHALDPARPADTRIVVFPSREAFEARQDAARGLTKELRMNASLRAGIVVGLPAFLAGSCWDPTSLSSSLAIAFAMAIASGFLDWLLPKSK